MAKNLRVVNGRRFGRVIVPDGRDRRFAIRAQSSTRKARTWTDTSPVLDQGATSECVGHAWAHWLSNNPVKQFLRATGIYELAKYRDEWRGEQYDGTSVRAGASVLKSLGMISEYRWATTLDSLIYALLEEGPVVVGTDWYEGMSKPAKIRDRYELQIGGRNQGGHAWLISSIDTTVERFGMKQSWGLKWADDGRAFVSFQTMDRLLRAQGEACLAIEASPGA